MHASHTGVRESGHSATVHLDVGIAPGLPAIELHAGRAFAHSHPPHWHDEYFVSAITGGEGRFRFRGDEHPAPAGTVVLIVPGEVHAHTSGRRGRSFRSMHAGRGLVEGLVPELTPGMRSHALADARVLRRFLSLHRVLESPVSVILKESRLAAFFLELSGRVPTTITRRPPAPERAAVRRAREYLEETCSPRVSLRDLASLSGLSPFHFHRIFRAQVGMPPHEYQLRRRLVRARELLGRGQSVADVAAETGFADQSHLTRHFKRLLGLPPADYARRKNVQDSGAESA
jgi:AraC-like DNA-binding protein